MVTELSWKVGGLQGEGIETTGEIFARALHRLGYQIYVYRYFTSRIKGGHTNSQVRVSTAPIATLADALDLLVAIDQETIDFNHHELRPGGIVIADGATRPHLPEGSTATLYALPLVEIATELGAPLMKNMVALGASLAVLGLETGICDALLHEALDRKGETVVARNLAALQRGREAMAALLPDGRDDLRLSPVTPRPQLLMTGNDAIALGALAGGCRFMAAYPITPTSEIMESLIKQLPQFGGAVIQSEDEIAACTLTIGANYAGVRAITASSGPGLSLMAEAIGLAGMTETPLVVIDSQRGGPSTGLPTKHEQSDLLAMIYSTHGEVPKIILAPSDAEDAFYLTSEALNLAEEYQCPVILLADLQLSLAKQSIPPLDYDRIQIRRGQLQRPPQLPEPATCEDFKRFAVTPDGISPRLLPGTKNRVFHVTGVEHDELGRPVEGAANHIAQMDKRLRKLDSLHFPAPLLIDGPHPQPELLLLGFGSTRGAISEAVARLRAAGYQINAAQLRLLHPFPTAALAPLMAAAQKIAVVEQNATGQLASLLRMHLGYNDQLISIRKYDGNPFTPGEIHQQAQEALRHGAR